MALVAVAVLGVALVAGPQAQATSGAPERAAPRTEVAGRTVVREEDQASFLTEEERRFVDLINWVRFQNGKGLYVPDRELTYKARVWATVMANDGVLRHSDLLSGVVVENWRILGENVGRSPNSPGVVERLHDAFVASPSHLANLLDDRFGDIGVGVMVAPNGTLYVAQEFGGRR